MYVHTYIQTYKHTLINTYIHTHMHSCIHELLGCQAIVILTDYQRHAYAKYDTDRLSLWAFV